MESELELDLGRGLRGALEVSEAEQPGWMESIRLELGRPPAWLGAVRARVPVLEGRWGAGRLEG